MGYKASLHFQGDLRAKKELADFSLGVLSRNLQNIQMEIFSWTLYYPGQFGSKIQEIPLESKLGGQSLEQFQSFSGCGTIV